MPKRGAAVLCPYEGSVSGEMAVVEFFGTRLDWLRPIFLFGRNVIS